MPDDLVIRDLDVRFRTGHGEVQAVKGVNLELRSGECLGLVGESGSGKSQLVLGALGLLAANGRATGSVRLGSLELLGLDRRGLDEIRGRDIGMVFQDPMTSLTPHRRVGDQIAEVLELHRGLGRNAAAGRARDLLERLHVADAGRRLRQYPHELSGGMRQRVLLAIALACEPRLLIADEPTSALDVTVQAEILSLLQELRAQMNLGVLLITHDFGVVAELADRVAVMYAGRLVEEAPAAELFSAPRHRYTAALLQAVPRLTDSLERELATIPGQPAELRATASGCAFAPRCHAATVLCHSEVPNYTSDSKGRKSACHHPLLAGRGEVGS